MTGAGARDRLERAADRLLGYPFQAWFYGDSIGFEGLLAADDLLGGDRYSTFAHGFLRGWAARDRQYRPDDNTAPGHVLCGLAERTGDRALRDAALGLGEHLAARRRIGGVSVTFEDARRSLREPYGPVSPTDAERALIADPGAGIYVDCLHFDPPFFAHLARLTGEPAWAGLAVEEALGYVRLLEDPGTGLYRHFWLERTGTAYGLGWGRGQGWALLGLLDVVGCCPTGQPGSPGERPPRPRGSDARVPAARRRVVSGRPQARLGRRDVDSGVHGRWVPAGDRLGVLDRDRLVPAASRAWAATWHAVDPDGLLTGVSAAVYSSPV